MNPAKTLTRKTLSFLSRRNAIAMSLLAGSIALVAGLLGAQQLTDQTRNPLAGNAAAVAAGKQRFSQTCETCHGQGAQGGRAPALMGRTFTHGAADSDLFQTIRVGVSAAGMPSFSTLATDQTWQLVTYLRSLTAAIGPATPETVPGNAAAGEALFFGSANCSTCHYINSRGGVVGPELSAVGRLPMAALRGKLLNPSVNIYPGVPTQQPTVVVAKSKIPGVKEIRGRHLSDDAFHLLLMDASGTRHRLDKNTLASIETRDESLMPAVRLPETDLTNLIAYLKTLTSRDYTKTIQVDIPGGLGYDRVKNSAAEPQNWLTFWGDYQGHHYSPLTSINASNVGQLQAKWSVQIPGNSILESTPIVVDGIMYTSGMPGEVRALDAKTGLGLWRYTRQQKVVNPAEANRFSRGVAVLGNRVFLGTLDAALIALDARTGQLLWEKQISDTMQGYSLTSPPLAIDGMIITGMGGGEYGIRGFIDAYDPKTGARLWRFYTVPGPGEPGHQTWKSDSWEHGGAATWLTGSYDPESDTLYWATGNPGPDWDWKVREGDDLYSCSVLAMDPNTGKLKWHYQFTPGDSHDWDSTEDMVLVDRMWHGKPRKLLLHADRNGMFYVLDRATGEFLQATNFVKQNWNEGFDAKGRPKVLESSKASTEGAIVAPSVIGGTNFQAPSYSPITGYYYVQTLDFAQRYTLAPEKFEAGKQYKGGGSASFGEPQIGAIKAIDPETGKIVWEFPVSRTSFTAGVLSTAGNVVFAATAEGNLIALDARTGKSLWHYQTGASMSASPMSYSVDGKQFVSISAGNVLYSFGLPE
ncbi:MAG: PQQ-dependent dehydrogenase, methanol/ethanol family [Acidobacteriota bacterium]